MLRISAPCVPLLRHVRAITNVAQRTPIAVAFDIDGVLKQGSNVLPEALRAVKMLQGDNPWHQKVPYLFITNSGGKLEAARAKDLSEDFRTTVVPQQVVQAHTGMRSLAEQYADKPILMIGGPDMPPGATRNVLESYGFRHVYTAHDLHSYAPASWPYSVSLPEQDAVLKRVDFANIHFAAILVLHDSREWGRDIQYCVDLLRSDGGVFGTALANDQLRARPAMPIYFSHADLMWGNEFSVPRLGQGAFRIALEAVYARVTEGNEFRAYTYGKPEVSSYEYANNLLQEMLRGESDHAGANNFGWSSVLVRTGVYRDVDGPPSSPPTLIVDNVAEAIKSIMKRTWS
ncbi:hypothetical protein MVES1_001798 [Malassezia vespertilionis]|uniref:Uncharacterized protein n=1 Tax=Malassezia vespertilionis TaxID=2020962 RepID=A0A2N1JDD7_9BASI|nr:uncharacterized protein MVES1_001798 [Malassezia vespertilionis]PKI84570.1 hypothetical protein MVES_001697 [Malassezia vespertilionis]WFD06453.1 hypothetical protein MVES1_001798 [Malassezia vespertilionis]